MQCEWDEVWAALWHDEARGAGRMDGMAGKAGGVSQWRCKAGLPGPAPGLFLMEMDKCNLAQGVSPTKGRAGASPHCSRETTPGAV